MSQDLRICFVGDSFVNGTGDRTYLGWTGRLCLDLAECGHSVTFYNLGVRRETSADIAQRWEAETQVRFPHGSDNRIIFSFGTNDTTVENHQCRLELAESIHYARQILTQAQQKYPVLMVGPPAIADADQNLRTAALSKQLESLCAAIQVPYLDLLTPLSDDRDWMHEVVAGDGAHPVASGYAAIAKLVQQWSGWLNWFSLHDH